MLKPKGIGSVVCRLAIAYAIVGHQLSVAFPPAFPEAVGQGASASGGRGGDVYHVTSLADYRPHEDAKLEGTLRHAIRSAEAPRTIVFDIGGPIALKAPLEILKDDLTIAGQTAPEPGITLWGYPVEISQCSNVIVRYLRVRLGDFHVPRDPADPRFPFAGNGDLDPETGNAFSIQGGSDRIIVDHVSTSWGIDETFSVTKCRDVTVQNCIIAASLNNSFHPKGTHGYGSLIRGEVTANDSSLGVGGFTFYQNLWAHHRARSPSLGGDQRLEEDETEADRRQTDVNLVNNVVYNWKDQPTHRSSKGTVYVNLVGNYYINGPEKDAVRIFKEGVDAVTHVYHTDNMMDYDQDALHNGVLVRPGKTEERAFRDFSAADSLISAETGEPFRFYSSVAAQARSAEDAYQRVLRSCGCSLYRDAIDQQVLDSVVERTGKLIDSQQELRDSDGVLHAIDDLSSRARPADFDTDQDGMPNAFEMAHQLDPNDPSDGKASTLNEAGYTNLEVYLNGIALQKSPGL